MDKLLIRVPEQGKPRRLRIISQNSSSCLDKFLCYSPRMDEAFSRYAPKYFVLSQHLRQQIVNGELRPETQLPTEEALAKTFTVSRGTVRKAIDLLESQRLVRREQGRGTFVADPIKDRLVGFSLSNFAQEMQQQRRPSTQVLRQEVVPASAEVAARLDVAVGELVITICRLRLADNQPILYEERFLRETLCPSLATEDVENQSIHWLLVHKYKVPLVRVTHTVEMRPAEPQVANLLQIPAESRVFAVDRLTYTLVEGGVKTAVYYRARCRGDEMQFRTQFNALI